MISKRSLASSLSVSPAIPEDEVLQTPQRLATSRPPLAHPRLLAEDSWLNVYGRKLEVRPPPRPERRAPQCWAKPLATRGQSDLGVGCVYGTTRYLSRG